MVAVEAGAWRNENLIASRRFYQLAPISNAPVCPNLDTSPRMAYPEKPMPSSVKRVLPP